jgi:hypothetical protein
MNTRKVLASAAAAMMLLALLAVLVAAVTVTGINFEIDGNTAAHDGEPPGNDWESVIPAGTATLIQDGNAGPRSAKLEENIFAKGGKFGDPAGWTIQTGNVPARNDLTDMYVSAYGSGDSVSGDSWIVMGMHRINKQGTVDLDFEFNQVPWDGTSGSLERTEGDIVVGFELPGDPAGPDDLQVLILYYRPADPECDDPFQPYTRPGATGRVYGAGFCEVFRGPARTLEQVGAAAMNEFAFPAPPWGAFDADGSVLGAGEQVQPYFFGEAAIDLTQLGITLGCPGYGSVHAKSRSSLEVTAGMRDLAGPATFTKSCYIDGHKWHDLNANGRWDKLSEPPLQGWTIELQDGACTPGKDCLTTTTDENGYYKFDRLGDGSYRVVEVCPSTVAWYQSYPGPNRAATCGGNDYTVTISYADPIHTDNDFGNYRNVVKTGYTLHDLNANGGWDLDEPVLDGWQICAGADCVTTGDGAWAAGYYEFSLKPGTYTFCETLKGDWNQSFPTSGAACANGTTGYEETLVSGDPPHTDNDFGNYRNVVKSGVKY